MGSALRKSRDGPRSDRSFVPRLCVGGTQSRELRGLRSVPRVLAETSRDLAARAQAPAGQSAPVRDASALRPAANQNGRGNVGAIKSAGCPGWAYSARAADRGLYSGLVALG